MDKHLCKSFRAGFPDGFFRLKKASFPPIKITDYAVEICLCVYCPATLNFNPVCTVIFSL